VTILLHQKGIAVRKNLTRPQSALQARKILVLRVPELQEGKKSHQTAKDLMTAAEAVNPLEEITIVEAAAEVREVRLLDLAAATEVLALHQVVVEAGVQKEVGADKPIIQNKIL
jgi:transcriptional antiterminator Rof (Rho-off)